MAGAGRPARSAQVEDLARQIFVSICNRLETRTAEHIVDVAFDAAEQFYAEASARRKSEPVAS